MMMWDEWTGAVRGATGVTDYASSILYSPFGGVAQITLGNTLVEKWGYSDMRGQVRRIALGTAVNETAAGEWLFSHCAGGLSTAECRSNNGNVRHQTVNPLGKIQSYSYDGLNRLSAVVERATVAAAPSCSASGPDPCRWFDFDQFGNMRVSAAYVSAWIRSRRRRRRTSTRRTRWFCRARNTMRRGIRK